MTRLLAAALLVLLSTVAAHADWSYNPYGENETSDYIEFYGKDRTGGYTLAVLCDEYDGAISIVLETPHASDALAAGSTSLALSVDGEPSWSLSAENVELDGRMNVIAAEADNADLWEAVFALTDGTDNLALRYGSKRMSFALEGIKDASAQWYLDCLL